MPGPHQITADILTGPHQVPGRLLPASGTDTSTISSSRNSRHRCSASLASVLTRFPAGRTSFDGAATRQAMPRPRRKRANP